MITDRIFCRHWKMEHSYYIKSKKKIRFFYKKTVISNVVVLNEILLYYSTFFPYKDIILIHFNSRWILSIPWWSTVKDKLTINRRLNFDSSRKLLTYTDNTENKLKCRDSFKPSQIYGKFISLTFQTPFLKFADQALLIASCIYNFV